jgi:uncharacterized protein (TIGR02996 family)
MNEQQRFLKAILDNPKDWDTRLVYADWLEEHDFPEEATRQRKYRISYEWMKEFAFKHHPYSSYNSLDEYNEEELREHEVRILNDWLHFLHGHTLKERELDFGDFYVPFSRISFSEYTDEMWAHFEVLTGEVAPTDWKRTRTPNFSCSC